MVSPIALERWEHPAPEGFLLRGWRTAPSGRPVIHFMHGTGLCSLAYRPFLSCLAKSYDLFLYDIQGHGDSEQGPRFLGWLENARAAHEVWNSYRSDYHGIPVVGLGHSMGGTVTLLRAAHYTEDFVAVCLLDPIVLRQRTILNANLDKLFGYQRKIALVESAKTRRNGWPDSSSATHFFRHRGMFKSWDEASLNAYVENCLKSESAGLKLKCSPKFEAEVLSSMPEQLWSSIKKIRTRTHILFGESSNALPTSTIAKLQRRSPFISAHALEGGHFFVQEKPAETAASIISLLSTEQW